jgi:HEAT repeat protein
VTALAKFKNKQAIIALRQGAKDRTGAIRQAIEQAIEQIESAGKEVQDPSCRGSGGVPPD